MLNQQPTQMHSSDPFIYGYGDFDTEQAIRAASVTQQDIPKQPLRHFLNHPSHSPLQLRGNYGYPFGENGLHTCLETFDELRESIRRLSKLQEDGYEAPTSSPVLRDDACMSPFSDDSLDFYKEAKEPPRSTSFDYKDAMRVSQKLMEEEPRLSVDSRTIPKCVLEIRQALQAHLDEFDLPTGCSIAESKCTDIEWRCSVPSSTPTTSPKSSGRRPPSIIARLMGLENLPDVPVSKPTPVQKKSSKEARSLQELLHCKPLEGSAQFQESTGEGYGRFNPEHAPPKHTLSFLASRSKETRQVDAKVSAKTVKVPKQRMEEQTVSLTKMQGSVVGQAISKKQDKELAEGQAKMKEILEGNVENGNFQDEIEEKLRQLGLQSSEHERKTLKQILEAMHLKGLFQDPHLKQPQELRMELESRIINSSSLEKRILDTSLNSDNSATAFNQNSTPRVKSSEKKTQAPIVIIKPISKACVNIEDPSSLINHVVDAERIPRIKERSCRNEKMKRKSNSSSREQQLTDRLLSKDAFIASKPRREHYIDEMIGKCLPNQAPKSGYLKNLPNQALSKTKHKEENRKRPSLLPNSRIRASSPQEGKPIRSTKEEDRNSVFFPARKGHHPSKASEKKLIKLIQQDESRDRMNRSGRLIANLAPPLSDNLANAETNNQSENFKEPKVAITVKIGSDMDSQEEAQSSPVSVLDVTKSDTSENSLESTAQLPSHQPTNEYPARGSLFRQFNNHDDDMHVSHSELPSDFDYVHEIMLATSVDTVARRWFLHGNPIDVNGLYMTLEAQKEGDEDKVAMVDKDYGGELYMKSRQEAMRRRLLLECVNELLSKKLRKNVFQQERRKGRKEMMKEIWKDFERLMTLPSLEKVGQDDIHNILEKDLRVEGHYGDNDAHLITISNELGEIILLDLVEEIVSL